MKPGCFRDRKQTTRAVFFALFAISLFPFVANSSQVNTRRVSVNESHPLDTTRTLASASLYVPRQILNGTLHGIQETATFLSDPDVIDQIKDILYLYERKLLWFPTASFGSGFRPNYGGGLHFSDQGFKATARVSHHDSDYWAFKGNVNYTHQFEAFLMKTSVSGLLENKDDRRFYGLGADPDQDSRNQFINLSDHDYGVFTEQRKKLQWKTAVKPNDEMRFQYLGYYQRRGVEDAGKGENPLRDIFDLTSVPGFTNGAITQIYNETSFEFDTRSNKKMLSPGFRGETYVGISSGIRTNPSDFLRAGFDAAFFIPTIKEDRLIVPRVSVAIVEDMDSEPIPFTEYPRHYSFRGIGARSLIHNDELSVAPSLEYQWPISHIFSGHVFFDSVLAGRDLGDLKVSEGIWAVGGGINLHYFKQELGRVQFAGGSEGFKALLTFGVPFEKNPREDW